MIHYDNRAKQGTIEQQKTSPDQATMLEQTLPIDLSESIRNFKRAIPKPKIRHFTVTKKDEITEQKNRDCNKQKKYQYRQRI